MNTNTNFSFARLMAVMKRDLIENWKTNLYRIIGCYSGLAVGFLSFMISMSGDYPSTYEFAYNSLCNSINTFLSIFISIYMIFCASSILEVTNTKEKRISYLMLPASASEKFISRALYVTVGALFIFIISLLLAELTRLALLPLFNVPENFRTFCLGDILILDKYELFGTTGLYFILFLVFWLSFLLWNHSIFILGGCYFKKHPFIKTVGICMAISFLTGLISVSMIESGKNIISLFNWIEDMAENHAWMRDINITTSIASSFFMILTVVNWTISYRLFKKSQITERKLFRL